ncbi:cation diffusion facilitator family transporter [Enterococcus sp.]|uniref:cation diffusion facilitator family transporter n=1 Tax=Enterococcus sp. TaxID=35783 RepID=UPI0037C1ABCB
MADFIQKDNRQNGSDDRVAIGVRAGWLGLGSNLVLFIGKFLIGLSAGSVSIMADAINSLTDTASSLLTLIGFRIAGKPADSEHPYGHARFESISGFVVSLLITFVGGQFLLSSINKIITPEHIRLSPMLFVVLILSIGIKVWQGLMYRSLSKKIDSATLQASGQDSINDVITTVAVLLSAIVEWLTGWRVDGYVGLLIALYILYNGIQMIRTFINDLLGSRPTEAELTEMEERLASYQTILGFHDLLVHNYGPSNRFASVHIEVDDTWTLNQAHQVIDQIEHDFFTQLQVELVCHLDPVPIHDPHYRQLRQAVKRLLRMIDPQLRMHDFRVSGEKIYFDLVIPNEALYPDAAIRQMMQEKMTEELGNYVVEITFDHSYLL